MHYRCVLYLLLWCVLVGLDWAEPIMNLYLHVTCSCILMHTYLQFYILWYIYCWYFSNCLLFLSFSPSYVSCVMAPKRKSIPSQNSLCSGASSSSSPSDPTPSHIQFCDEKAKSNFFENFSLCGIHSECQVVLSNFSDTDLPTVIYSRG